MTEDTMEELLIALPSLKVEDHGGSQQRRPLNTLAKQTLQQEPKSCSDIVEQMQAEREDMFNLFPAGLLDPDLDGEFQPPPWKKETGEFQPPLRQT